MNARRPIYIGLVAVLALSSLGLEACGKQGGLERPGPLLERRAERRAQRQAAARADGEANRNSSATSQTNGDYTQPSDGAKDPALQPYRTNPPPGASGPLSGGGRLGGSLPDPFADPNRAPR